MTTRRNFLALLGIVPAAVSTTAFTKQDITLAQAISKLEEGRVVKEGLRGPCCQTGNSYQTFTHGGVKEEGHPVIGFTATREEAIEGWLRTALLYAKDRPGTLYWREKPMIDDRERPDGSHDYMVYSRFVITDNPEVVVVTADPVESQEFVKIPDNSDPYEGMT